MTADNYSELMPLYTCDIQVRARDDVIRRLCISRNYVNNHAVR